MKKLYLILLLFLLIVTQTEGQYVVKSKNILTPEVNISFVRDNVQFWIDHAYDPVNGGFFSNVDRFGNVITLTDVHTNKTYKRKSFIAQTRQAYGFTRAFMLTGDESYLTYAQSALKFLTDYGWDTTNDGWYCFATETGALDHGQWWDPNNSKWGFQQQYALLGLVANYEATHDSNLKTWIEKGINSNYNHLWDNTLNNEGYFENTNLNWTNPSQKGFTCTVDAITTNAELLYLETKSPIYKTKLFQLADIISDRFIPLVDDANLRPCYPEVYSNNWIPDYSTGGSIGHFLKTAWCLGRAYLNDTTKKEYVLGAEKILSQAWTYNNANVTIWDHVNGGPFYTIDPTTYNYPDIYGIKGNSKEYWTLEQGFTGPMIMYYITKNPTYLQMADESLSFFMNHMIDKTYGETYQYVDANGANVVLNTKGDDFKANYHVTELAYYAYLYSNLYYLHQPASLYYKFAPQAGSQTIQLTPISIEDNKLKIKSVTLNGVEFNNFDPDSRTLNIAANQGGKFKVTFESTATPSATQTISDNYQIKVFPNPTTDKIIIDGVGNISKLTMLDITGKQIIQKDLTGNSSIELDVRKFAKGIYFIEFRNNSGTEITKRIIKN